MSYRVPRFEDRTLPRLLAHQTQRDPDSPFLRFGRNDALSFAEVSEKSDRIANALRVLGVKKGDRVAMLLPNCEALVMTWFAAAKLGAIEIPINPSLKGHLLAYVLKDCESSILICHPSSVGFAAEALRGQRVFSKVAIVDGTTDDLVGAGIATGRSLQYEELLESEARPLDPDVVSPCDPISIMYTSGTTGTAKGVISPHHQYYLWAERMAGNMRLTSEDVYYTPLPLFHGDAQFFGVYFPLVYGAQGVIYERFSVSRYWDDVRASRATATNMLGAMAHLLWKQPPKRDDRDHGIRVCQAIPMISMKEEFEQRFGLQLVTAYGQTETSLVAYDTPGKGRHGSCGKVSAAFSVRIVDEYDNPVPAGTVGEITIRPRGAWAIFLGYYGKYDSTVKAWRNLWFHSGDLGHLDDDGWLYFAGRAKDVIRRRGENISAQDLESVFVEHPAVAECAAVAVPSELTEDEIKLVVVAKPGYDVHPADLVEFCLSKLPRQMIPRYIEICREPLPRTPSEKVAKEELRKVGTTRAWDREAAMPRGRRT